MLFLWGGHGSFFLIMMSTMSCLFNCLLFNFIGLSQLFTLLSLFTFIVRMTVNLHCSHSPVHFQMICRVVNVHLLLLFMLPYANEHTSL